MGKNVGILTVIRLGTCSNHGSTHRPKNGRKIDKHDSKAGLRNSWTSPSESTMLINSSRNAFPTQKNRFIIHKDQALSCLHYILHLGDSKPERIDYYSVILLYKANILIPYINLLKPEGYASESERVLTSKMSRFNLRLSKTITVLSFTQNRDNPKYLTVDSQI